MGPKGQEIVEAYVVLAIACRQVFGRTMYGMCVVCVYMCVCMIVQLLLAILFLGE